MNVFIEKVSPWKKSYINFIIAANGFEHKGYTVGFIPNNEIKYTWEKDTVFFGTVNFVNAALKHLGKQIPPNIDLPECLNRFIKRKVWPSTMGEARELKNIHVKPLIDHKLFNGTVIKEFKDLISTSHISPATKVLCQELKEIESEWRCYALYGKIEHIGHYKGNPLLFPNPHEMKEAAEILYKKTGMASFGIDWAVNKNESFLIEVNDCYSLGNYGCYGPLYASMIEARWKQICSK